MKKIRHINDFVLSILTCITGIWLLFGKITEAPVKTGQGGFMARSDIWLRMMAVFMIIVAVALFVRSFTGKDFKEEDAKFHFYLDSTVVATVVALIIYAIALPKLGFFITTFLGTFYLMLLYSIKERAWSFTTVPAGNWGKLLLKCLIVSAILLAIFWLVFGKLLAVQLPEFALFG